MSRLEAKRQLEQQLRDGRPAPKTAPTRLHLAAIHEAPEVFQFRDPHPHTSRAHVEEMAKAVRDRHALAAVVVWWGGTAWYCIDGHHRLAAYRKGQWPHGEPIPVSVFGGELDQALMLAVGSNAPDRLPMSKAEKTNAAWELVVTTTATKAQLARRACVSERSVAYMRKAADQLRQKDPSRDLSAMPWWEARREAAGEAPEEMPDYDAKDVEEAKGMADKLARTFGKRISERPEVFALALEFHDRRLPTILPEAWQAQGYAAGDFEDAEEERPDF